MAHSTLKPVRLYYQGITDGDLTRARRAVFVSGTSRTRLRQLLLSFPL